MSNHNHVNQAVEYALLASAAVAALGYAPMASAANAGTPAHLGKVTVTGTRIKRTSIETAQPVMHIGRQQIEQSGFTNIGQLFARLSFGGFGRNSKSNNTRTTVALRELGDNRTLVLVNGKRWIPGLGGVTNLNTIPTSIIDHIEILQDGASAVYGSDAIAGVVNIITIRNFNGAEAHAYYGIRNGDGHWDGQEKQYDFTIGGGNNRGNVVFNATYREQNGIFRNARKLTKSSIAGVTPRNFGGSSTTPRGRFRLFGPAVSGRAFGQGACDTYNPKKPNRTLCDLTLINAPAPPSLQNFRDYKSSDAYNLTAQQYQQVPDKLVSAYVQGHYNLFDNVTFSANAAYIREEVHKDFGPDGTAVGLRTGNTANGKKIGIAATNPYNPFGVDLVADTSDPCLAAGTCIGLSGLSRRIAESHGVNNYNRDSFHIFAGFSGYLNFLNRKIDWDAGFSQDRKQGIGIGQLGVYKSTSIAKALGPAKQCTAPCAPLNFFSGSVFHGAGSITQDQLNYINYEPHDVSQTNLRDWTANISSDVYDLPAGPLGLAIGYERVDNYGYTHPDSVEIEGNSGGARSYALNGRVVRDAEYGELNIPLFADLPGVKNLSVDIANRWTQFERSGGVTNQNKTSFVHNSSGRLNIRYQVNNDLLLRASWSQGFRSPSVSELFSGTSSTYTTILDPCARGAFGGNQGGPLPPNCPNGMADVQLGQGFNVRRGGNANLEPENSISRTAGFVYSPSQLPGLDVNADYFKIELTNKVGTVGAQNIINGCFYNASFCKLITVTNNQITRIRDVSTNVGSEVTEGIDVGLHYKFPSTPIGDFDARINGTILTAFDESVVNRSTRTGFATSHRVGTTSHPERRFNGFLNWSYGNWSARYRIEYYSDTVDQCRVSIKGYCTYPNKTANFQGTPGIFALGRNHLGTTVYHDVHFAYTAPTINTTFALGVNNLFDKKPPIGGNGHFRLHAFRPPSRVLYGSIRVRF